MAALSGASGKVTSDDWVPVNVCHVRFLLPANLKRTTRKGIDSCIAEFENRKMLLSIDYGWYGGPARESDVTLDFREEAVSIGGKTGTISTYVDNSLYARNHPERKYVTHVYVVAKATPDERASMTTSLMMEVRSESKKQLQIAERIFRNVRFE